MVPQNNYYTTFFRILGNIFLCHNPLKSIFIVSFTQKINFFKKTLGSDRSYFLLNSFKATVKNSYFNMYWGNVFQSIPYSRLQMEKFQHSIQFYLTSKVILLHLAVSQNSIWKLVFLSTPFHFQKAQISKQFKTLD